MCLYASIDSGGLAKCGGVVSMQCAEPTHCIFGVDISHGGHEWMGTSSWPNAGSFDSEEDLITSPGPEAHSA